MHVLYIYTPPQTAKHTHPYATGTRKISIHLTFNMPIYERNVNCLIHLRCSNNQTLTSSISKWYWCMTVAHFHFTFSLSQWVRLLLTLSVWNVWAWVRFCGLRCFLSSRCVTLLHIYRRYISFAENDFFFARLYMCGTHDAVVMLIHCIFVARWLAILLLFYATLTSYTYFNVSLLSWSFIIRYRILISLWIRLGIVLLSSFKPNMQWIFIYSELW